MRLLISLLIVFVMFMAVPQPSSATMVYGVPTDGSGTAVGSVIDNKVLYYIPLRLDTSGTYGVGGVGLSSDSVRASNLGGTLNMYIEFNGFDYPAATASTTFWFKDLDLLSDNDPDRFTETVQFSIWNGGGYQPVTPLITNASVYTTPFLSYSITGNNDNRYITFDDVTSYLPSSGSFKWLLQFTSDYVLTGLSSCYNPCLTNTIEKLSARLETSPVPEPATMLLLGSGLIAFAGIGRKRFFNKKK